MADIKLIYCIYDITLNKNTCIKTAAILTELTTRFSCSPSERWASQNRALFQVVEYILRATKTTMKTGQSVKIVKPKMEAHIACYSSVSTVDLLGKLASETAEKDI